MRELFKKRRSTFIIQCLKYLRYVLNDHFILVLIFLFGFLLVQYSNLLIHFPKQTLPISLTLILVIATLLGMGRIGSYLEPADKLFLLTKEKEVIALINQATFRTFLIWGGLQTVLLIFLMPIFLKMGLSITNFAILLGFLVIAKWSVVQYYKRKHFFENDCFSWDKAIVYEVNRKQAILKFYSLFTNVKGVSSSVKRHKFLDIFLRLVSKTHSEVWSNLYFRAFLRSSSYLALSFRLFGLAVLALVFISNRFIAVGLALSFDYLLVFQLLALYRHYDYQYLTNLYPISSQEKGRNFKLFLKKIAYIILFVELCLVFSWQAGLILFGIGLIITEWYLPYKIKKMID